MNAFQQPGGKMADKSIPFIVDEEHAPVRSARSPFDHIVAAQASKIIDIQITSLASELHERIADLNQALSQVDTSGGPYELDAVALTMGVTASGKLAILATIEGAASQQLGIQLTLRRKRDSNDS
jgi:hypothetical protein